MKALVILVLLVLLSVWCSAMSKHELQEFSNFLRKTSSLDQRLKGGISSDEESDEEADDASDDAWETSGKFEGDLILNDRQRRLIVENVAEGLSRNGLTDSTKRWPDNEVIYYIQKEHFSSDQVQAIQDGIDDIERASCIKFRPYKKGDRDAVVIQGTRRGCFSQVGYQGGYQVLNLSGRHPVGRGCFRHGTVVHEMLHTLGFYHMQSSPDRDDYIDVRWENIIQPARHNFKKYNSFSVSDFGVGYDYDSVLHYSRRAFSANGEDTLVPKQGGAQIGQRVGLSDKDTQKLNKMYCDADSNNNFDAEEVAAPAKPANKKKAKNQPFQGHGIGYHKGKTVIIKLPAAETFILPDQPSYQMFDYFSKAPQAVPPTLAQGFRTGQEMNKSHPVARENEKKNTATSSHEFIDSESLSDLFKTKENDENNNDRSDENINIFQDTSKSGNSEESSESLNNDEKEDLKEIDKNVGKHARYPSLQHRLPKTDYSKLFSPSIKYQGYKDAENVQIKSIDQDKPTYLDKPYLISHTPQYSKKGSQQDDVFNKVNIIKENKKPFDSSYGTKFPFKKLSKHFYVIPNDVSLYVKDLENRNNYDSNHAPRKADLSNISDADEFYTILGKPVPLADSWYRSDQIKNQDDYNYKPKTSYDLESYNKGSVLVKKPANNHDILNYRIKQIRMPTLPTTGWKNPVKLELFDSPESLRDLAKKQDFSVFYTYQPESKRQNINAQPYIVLGSAVPLHDDIYKKENIRHERHEANDANSGQPYSLSSAEYVTNESAEISESKKTTSNKPVKSERLLSEDDLRQKQVHITMNQAELPKDPNKSALKMFSFSKEEEENSSLDALTVKPVMYEVKEQI